MISTFKLSKFYDTRPAVRDVSLFVGAGETCALVGPNGAGKTTLLKMLAGLLRPTSGKIEVAGGEVGVNPKRLHEIIGYVPDTFGLYDELSVRHFLEYFARAYRIGAERIEKRTQDVLALTGLSEKIDAACGSLSRGMQQRLVIAKTLLHAPKVLLLDEPSAGLDPRARLDLSELIRQLAALGTTLVVSSHILTELADFCDSIVIMERGQIMRAGKVSELVGQLSAKGIPVRVELLDNAAVASVAASLGRCESVGHLIVNGRSIDFTFASERAALAQVHREIVSAHEGVVSFYERQLTIEDVFMAASSHQVS